MGIRVNSPSPLIGEEPLKASRADDLDHAGRRGAGVPHRVQLAARLGDGSTGTENDLAISDRHPISPS
jgi:hypothetical protein